MMHFALTNKNPETIRPTTENDTKGPTTLEISKQTHTSVWHLAFASLGGCQLSPEMEGRREAL